MSRNPNTHFQVFYEKLEAVPDSRFTKVKVWVAHTGKNLNGSIFTKEVLAKMAEFSLANIPILGYIEEMSDDSIDFKGHETKLVVNKNGTDIIYLGKAYGLVPVDNQHTFEHRLDKDGVMREWLVCYGLLWNKFADALSILERDGSKGQSMELEIGSIVGSVNQDGDFVFEDAKFEGLCILGANVRPAMVNANIVLFSGVNIKQQLQEMIAEFYTHNKGCDTMENLNHTPDTPVVDAGLSAFQLTHAQIVAELQRLLQEVKYVEHNWIRTKYWYIDSDAEHVYVNDVSKNDRIFGLKYSVIGDGIAIDFDSAFPVRVAFVPVETQDAQHIVVYPWGAVEAFAIERVAKETSEYAASVDTKDKEIVALQAECANLRAYQVAKTQEERQEAIDTLFAEFAAELSEAELSQVRINISDQSIGQVRDSLFALVGKKKAKFTATLKPKGARVTLGGGEDAPSVGGKTWGYLVEQTLGKRI